MRQKGLFKLSHVLSFSKEELGMETLPYGALSLAQKSFHAAVFGIRNEDTHRIHVLSVMHVRHNFHEQ